MKQENNDRFKNRAAAFAWLQAEGVKVSNGKFFGDCQKGFVTVHPDGSVSKYEVMEYGKRLEAKTTCAPADELREYKIRKAKAEAEIAEHKAEKMQRLEDKEWLHAQDAWAVVAALVGTLRDTIQHYIYIRQRDIVFSCAGDQNRAEELFEMINSVVSEAFHDVSLAPLQGEFVKKDEDEEIDEEGDETND